MNHFFIGMGIMIGLRIWTDKPVKSFLRELEGRYIESIGQQNCRRLQRWIFQQKNEIKKCVQRIKYCETNF